MNNKIKIKTIIPETIEVFSNKSDSLGKLNEIEFLDLRCQIKKYRIKGFYIYYNAEKIFIDKYGMLEKRVPIFVESIYKYNYLLGIKNSDYEQESNSDN